MIGPLGIVVALRLVPADFMAERRAIAILAGSWPVNRVAEAVSVLAWIGRVMATAWFFLHRPIYGCGHRPVYEAPDHPDAQRAKTSTQPSGQWRSPVAAGANIFPRWTQVAAECACVLPLG